MKKSLTLLALIAAFAMVLSSCTTRTKAVAVAPVNAQVNFDMDDLEYLGTVTGSNSQSYVLGIAVGGRKYHNGVMLSSGIQNPLPQSRGLNNAMYDALSQMPDADFVLPISYDTQVDQQFLGRREHLTIRCKAYKIKNK